MKARTTSRGGARCRTPATIGGTAAALARRKLGAGILLAAGALAVDAGAPAQAARTCPIEGGPVHVVLNIQSGKVSWRTGHTRGDLKRFSRRVVSSGSRRSGHPLGLTVAEFRLDMKTQVSVLPLGNNRFCAVPLKVEFSLGYPEFVVYIDRRYRTGTCQYRQIKAHEQRHVDVYRRQLRRFAPLVRGRLKEAAARLKPVFVERPDKAADLIQKRLKRKIDGLVDQLQKATDTDNGRLDTTRNYTRIQKRCRSW